MTDLGGTPSRRDEAATNERAHLLRQIAAALDLPVTALKPGVSADAGEGPSSSECAQMLAAFARVRDPQARAYCLALLESLATP